MKKVVKTTFEREQSDKEEAFFNLPPEERLAYAFLMKSRMRKPGINYSFKGKKVTIKKFA